MDLRLMIWIGKLILKIWLGMISKLFYLVTIAGCPQHYSITNITVSPTLPSSASKLWNLQSYDPKMEFNRLRSYSAGGDHRRARSNGHNSERSQSDTDSLPDFDQYWRRLNLSNGRNRRSISETEAQLMNLSSVKSIGPFQKERVNIFWFLEKFCNQNLSK